ncbi:alpha-hydroxy-acid oxidizing protein [Bradyrhizobium iriomotense]|uniref:alpha-hydroxy-acid oxidizing protein n=1 Tax=Bradyrhizobium iriomotense TaxID=441950 RepID=UPI001B8A4586|nr:alpha-hydroxy-acid oxidizing protein [Bradyrhizobium iriomotense]MBR1130821.1 alpha-hydroxy-acid oxidizing protein [Bradyrhizobium iriomotense]
MISRRNVLFGIGGAAVGGALTSSLGEAKLFDYGDTPVNVFDYRELARTRLPRIVFDYLEGGAGGEWSLSHNREIFERLVFRPKRLLDISKRDISTVLFGQKYAAPIVIAPTGLNGAFWPNGDIALARAAEKANIPFALSTASTASIEDVAQNAGGDKWFQLYVLNKTLSQQLVERAKAAGYSKLILTTDLGVDGLRERDNRNGFKLPLSYSSSLLVDGLTHPGWALDFAKHGMPKVANFTRRDASDTASQAGQMRRGLDTTFSWQDLKWLRSIWPRQLLVKGVLRPDDAVRCIAEGADGVILSNHGGRQLGDAISPLQALAETRSKITQPILIDSGFRRGADIVKALALGANAVQLGRATLYGLAARGEIGVTEVLNMMFAEIDNTMAQIGCSSIADLSPDCITEDRLPLAVRS